MRSLVITSAIVLGILGTSAPAWAGGKLEFYRDPPQAKAASLTSFKAGETIYVVATLTKSLDSLAEHDGKIGVAIEINGDRWGGIRAAIPAGQGGGKTIGFWLMSPKLETKVLRTLIQFLDKYPKGSTEVIVGVANNTAAKLKLDLTAGTAPYQPFLRATEQATLAANANVELPKPGITDVKLEAEIAKMYAAEVPHMKVFRVILLDKDWRVRKHKLTGAIEERSRTIALLSQVVKTGACMIEPRLNVTQPYIGDKYGALTRGGAGGSVREEPIPVPCERITK